METTPQKARVSDGDGPSSFRATLRSQLSAGGGVAQQLGMSAQLEGAGMLGRSPSMTNKLHSDGLRRASETRAQRPATCSPDLALLLARRALFPALTEARRSTA